MMTRILTIDGNWLARSRFEAVRGEDEEVFQAVMSFFKRMKDLIKHFEPETVAIAWDSPDLVRKRKFPNYKAQRPPAPQGFSDALRQIKNRAKEGRAYQFSSDGWEGDDVIATIASRMPGPHTVFSVDKDLFQIVSPSVRYYRSLGDGILYTCENIVAETGLSPEGWTEYLALVGDRADNIPGVRGVGDVAARLILSAYPGIVQKLITEETREGVLEEVAAMGDKKVIAAVEKCAADHANLTESWLSVRLNDNVELKSVAPEAL